MSYPYRCILPEDRYLYYEITVDSARFCVQKDLQLSIDDSTTLWHAVAQRSLPLLDIALQSYFCYEQYLVIESEGLLRRLSTQLFPDSIDSLPSSSLFDNQLRFGRINSDIQINFGGFGDAGDVGLGLFAQANIASDVFLGEYTGLLSDSVSRSEKSSAYCLQYPSCDGGSFIDASECGNIIRFVNHSSTPNAAFRTYFLDGMFHIICVSLQQIYCCWI